MVLNNFWSEGNNFLITTCLEFSEYWSKNTSSLWFELIIDNNTGIVIRADV